MRATTIGIAVVGIGGAMLASLPAARSQSSSEPFTMIAAVLRSPRCMNCHPAGDAPLQTDLSIPHTQNIKRSFARLGGTCETCHTEHPLDEPDFPPGAAHWSMPPAHTPMVFQGKTTAQLCADLQDTSKNGGRSLTDLVHHVENDPLVLWAFDPGGRRTRPPVTHAEFVTLMREWVALGAPCP